MLIWTLAILLFAVFGALGYAKGAIRMIFPLVGLFVGALLALPLGPTVRPVVPLVGLTNPIWSILLPPLLVFFLIGIVFVAVGFFGHWRVKLFYKYRTDDFQRLSWERLNKRLGVCMGLGAGAVYTILVGLVVYVLGYLTVQISPGESDSAPVRYLNEARADLHSSGLEKIVAAFDPAPESYYSAADILGLLYHNPALHSRLAAYPPCISLAERPEFQDIVTDAEYQNMLASQPSLGQILDHAKTQAILGNAEILQQLRAIDLKDLRDYLRTGVSEKYQDLPVLGRWELDPYLTLLQEKKRKVGMSSAEMRLLRYHMEFVKGFKLVVAPDNTAKLKGPDITQMVAKLAELAKAVTEGNRPRTVVRAAPVVVQPQADPQQASQDRLMMQRYGRRGSSAPAPTPTPAPVQVVTQTAPAAPPMTAAELAAEIAKLPIVVLAQGTWKEDAGKFKISLQAQKEIKEFAGTKKSSVLEAAVHDDRLFLTENNQGMVMARF